MIYFYRQFSTTFVPLIFPLLGKEPPAVLLNLSLYTLIPSLMTQNDGGEDDEWSATAIRYKLGYKLNQ